MRLTACCPVLNESTFIELWLKAVSEYCDEIVITDGGSTDGTVEAILEFQKTSKVPIDLKVQKQTGRPYSDDWNESVVRNDLLDRCHGDWIFCIDPDEFLGDTNQLDRITENKTTMDISRDPTAVP